MSGEELASRLEGVSYRYFPAAAFQYDSQEQEGYNLSGILLYVLIFLLIVEQILAWSASYHPPGLCAARIRRRRPMMFAALPLFADETVHIRFQWGRILALSDWMPPAAAWS